MLLWIALEVVPKPRIIAVMSVFYFLSNIFYITELWPINWLGNLRDDLRWPPQYLEDIGHQALMFFLGLWNCFHGVRVVGRETVPLGTVCRGLGFGFGTTFSGFLLFGVTVWEVSSRLPDNPSLTDHMVCNPNPTLGKGQKTTICKHVIMLTWAL